MGLYGGYPWVSGQLKIMVSSVRSRSCHLRKSCKTQKNLRAPVREPEPIYCNRDSAEGFVHRFCRRVAHSWEDVGIGVEGDS